MVTQEVHDPEDAKWICMECDEVRYEDARVEGGMKCGHCAYGNTDYVDGT